MVDGIMILLLLLNKKQMQTKKESHKEILTNQVVGLFGGWCIVYYLFPLFDYLSQEIVATISTIIFFIWSYLRSYVLRRYFNAKNKFN